jgi:hypothetical protein
MGVFDRIGKVVRAELGHRFRRSPGDAGDGDHGAAPRKNGRAAVDARTNDAPPPKRAVVDVEGALRVLELTSQSGASPPLADVRAQYQRLARRYWPKTQSGDADEAHAAKVVVDALTDALELLEEQLLPLA